MLDLRSLKSNRDSIHCDVPKCPRNGFRRFFWGGWFFGNYCRLHAKELTELWDAEACVRDGHAEEAA